MWNSAASKQLSDLSSFLLPSFIAFQTEQRHGSTPKETDKEGSNLALCGTHALEAARHHPDNYRPSSPLDAQSRVLITGILSPLGLLLALALHRRCGVTNFMGLDAQFPNEALARLEMQERLGVLMAEERMHVRFAVPFVGLVPERTGEERAEEVVAAPLPRQEARPGPDALAAVRDYRPTHVVHLAGTQADALLGSGYRAGGNHDGPWSPVLQDKEEEEEDLCREGISSRPHLYDLRMGAVGMEQLLSAAATSGVFPEESEKGRRNADAKGQRARRPHIVYASSYDALHFRHAATRDRGERRRRHGAATKTDAEDSDSDEFHAGSPSSPKRPPHGLHGVSRLIDELLSSSYRNFYGVKSVGLRFDALYGPRGYGTPSANVPVHVRCQSGSAKRGVSPDVDLAECAVRELHRHWMEAAATREEEEGEKTVGSREGKHSERGLVEVAGWSHLAHDRRDFVFGEGEI